MWARGMLEKRDLMALRFHAFTLSRFHAFTPNAHNSRRMNGGVNEVIALLRAMRCSRDGRPDKDEQVVGTGRKTRWSGRRLESETRSDSHAPPKRGARCRGRQGPMLFWISARSLGLVCSMKAQRASRGWPLVRAELVGWAAGCCWNWRTSRSSSPSCLTS